MISVFGNYPELIQNYRALQRKPHESCNYEKLMAGTKFPQFKASACVATLKALHALSPAIVSNPELEMLSYIQGRNGLVSMTPTVRQVNGLPVVFLGFLDGSPAYQAIEGDYEVQIGEHSLNLILSPASGDDMVQHYLEIPIAKVMEEGESHTEVNVKFAEFQDWANRVRGLPGTGGIKSIKLKEYHPVAPAKVTRIDRKMIVIKGKPAIIAEMTMENGDIVASFAGNAAQLFKPQIEPYMLSVSGGKILGGSPDRVSINDFNRMDYKVVAVRLESITLKDSKFDMFRAIVEVPKWGLSEVSLPMKSSDALVVNLRSILGKLEQITAQNPIEVIDTIVYLPEALRSKTMNIDF